MHVTRVYEILILFSPICDNRRRTTTNIEYKQVNNAFALSAVYGLRLHTRNKHTHVIGVRPVLRKNNNLKIKGGLEDRTTKRIDYIDNKY